MILHDTRTESANGSGGSAELKELIERFRVCWEALPDYYYVSGQRRQIGFGALSERDD